LVSGTRRKIQERTRRLHRRDIFDLPRNCDGFLKINPVTALFWTAVINGVVAPFLLIMRNQPASMLSRVVTIALLIMFISAVVMFVL
jgi:hypothetical protein